MSVELKLKSKDLNWLGKGFEKNSIISPFNHVKDDDFNMDDKKRLIDSGIVNENNEISAKYIPILEILSDADGFIQTTFSRGPISAEKLIFTSGERKISVIYDQEGVVINMPANPNAMVEYLKDFVGGSKLTGGDLSFEARAEEAFVFSVIVDLYKKDVFRAYANEEIFVFQGVSKDQVLEALNHIRANSQNLSYHLFVLNSGFEQFEMAQLDRIVLSLMEKSLVKTENNNLFPIGEGLLFAGNFLVIENIIELIIGQVKDENLYRSNFLMLQAGPLDIVYIEKSGDNIIMECMSSINATEFLATVLGEKPNIA